MCFAYKQVLHLILNGVRSLMVTWFLNQVSFSNCPSSIQLIVVLLRSFHTVLVIVYLVLASCLAPGPASFLACCLMSSSFRSLPCVWPIYKLVVL